MRKQKQDKPKFWANVVMVDKPELKLNFHPKAKGATIVEPPDEY